MLPKASFVKNWNYDVGLFLKDYFQLLTEQSGLSIEEVVADLLVTGNDEWNYPYLEASTEYVAFAVGMDTHGNPTTMPTFTEFTTVTPEPVDPVACTFDIEVSNIQHTSADFKISPSDKQIPYFYAIVKASDWDGTEDKAAFMHELVKNTIDEAMDEYGISYEEAVEMVEVKGDYGGNLEEGRLHTATAYALVAYGFDSYERANTEPGVERFSTPTPKPSANTFTITVNKTTAIDVSYRVETTNDDPYYTTIFTKQSIGSLSDADLIAMLEEQGRIGDYMNGSDNYDGSKMLFSDKEYQIIAVGYDNGATTPVTRKDFTTLPAGDPAACRFEFAFEPDTFKAGLEVHPTDETVFYYYNLLPVATYPSDEKLAEEVKNYLKAQSLGAGVTLEETLLNLYPRGDDAGEFATESLAKYYAVAYAFNPKDGSPAGQIYKKEFTAAERIVSDAVAEVEFSKYYNGAELYAIDPDKYAGGISWDDQPMAYVPNRVTHNAAAKTWYAALFGDNLSGNSDANIIINLIEYGAGDMNTEEVTWKMAYFYDVSYMGSAGLENTFCAVAIDKDGNYGPVFKKVFKLTTDGVSPVSEIANGSGNIPAGMPQRLQRVNDTHSSNSALCVRSAGKMPAPTPTYSGKTTCEHRQEHPAQVIGIRADCKNQPEITSQRPPYRPVYGGGRSAR